MPIYMKYEGIMGTGKGKYYGWIILESAYLETSPKGGLPENASGNISKATSFTLSKFYDSSSLLLVQDINLGKARPKVTIEFVQPNQSISYLTYQLDNASLSAYQASPSHNSKQAVIETYRLEFSSITGAYSIQNTHESSHAKQSVTGRK